MRGQNAGVFGGSDVGKAEAERQAGSNMSERDGARRRECGSVRCAWCCYYSRSILTTTEVFYIVQSCISSTIYY